MFAQQSLLRAVALALLLSVAYGQFVTDGLVRDREGLLALKNAVTDFGNSKIASWRPTGNPCFPKPWRHVLCGGGRVVEINLANLQVAGNLPAKLRLMDKLITLNMDGNKFTGGIPSSWAARSSFPNLKILSLSGNELSGELPNWNRAGAWRSLQVVDLSSNNFHGGLPANWLGKQRALRNVQTLDLSNNYLGRANGTVAGDALTRAQWCETEADASLYTGSGWCPAGTPIAGTLASMTSLDLSNNGLSGEIPAKWPVMMPQMQYLMLHFNNLHKEVSNAAVASVLPKTWSDLRRKAFPSLSILTLYPGNDYLCSVPDFDGFFDVNVDASYQVFDNIGTAYGGDNPRRCPTAFTADNAPTTPTMSKTAPTWGFVNPGTVWGFKVTFSRLSTEGQQWSTVPDWSSVLLRTYINSDDGFDADDVSAQGLVCDSDVCTLTFADITSSSLVNPTATLVQWGYSKLKMTVETINLDRVASSAAESPEINV